MDFASQKWKNCLLSAVVAVAHIGVLVPLVVNGSKIKRPIREVKVKVNLNSGELMTAPELGEPQIKAGGNPPAPEPPAPEPPAPEPPKPDPAIQQQKIAERNRKLAEQRRKKQIAERNRKLAEKRKLQQKIAERNRKLAENRRKAEAAAWQKRMVDAQNRKLAERRKRNSGVHHDSSWDNPHNIPEGNRNVGQRRGAMKNNPQIGGDSRAEDRYFAALIEYFKGRWVPPPGILGGEAASVLVGLQVGANGRILSWQLVERSPSAAVNSAVEQMLRKITTLPAPPNGAISFKIRLSSDML